MESCKYGILNTWCSWFLESYDTKVMRCGSRGSSTSWFSEIVEAIMHWNVMRFNIARVQTFKVEVWQSWTIQILKYCNLEVLYLETLKSCSLGNLRNKGGFELLQALHFEILVSRTVQLLESNKCQNLTSRSLEILNIWRYSLLRKISQFQARHHKCCNL